jgi:hypothetical protein
VSLLAKVAVEQNTEECGVQMQCNCAIDPIARKVSK